MATKGRQEGFDNSSDSTTGGAGYAPLQPTSLVEKVADLVKQRVLDGVVKEGDKVNIDSLARELSVSAVPVREALARLGAIGLLKFVPNKGYTVAPRLSGEERRRLFEARTLIERAAVSLAVRHATPEQIDQLCQLNTRIGKLSSKRRESVQQQFLFLNHEFHRTLLQMTGNEYLEKAYESLSFDLLMTRDDAERVVDYGKLHSEHAQIIEMIRAKDVSGLDRLLHDHIMGNI